MFRTLLQVLKQRNLMIQALDTTEEALANAEKITNASLAYLLDGTKPDFNLYLLDQEINRAAVDVRRMVFQHLATDAEGDLAPGLILTSIIIDIERIGDYAKNLGELAERYGGSLPSGPHHDSVRELSSQMQSMFSVVAGALHAGDAEVATEVMDQHQDLGRRCEEVIDQITGASGIAIKDAVTLALACRFLKRTSAHLSNLASSVANPFDRIGFTPHDNPPVDAD